MTKEDVVGKYLQCGQSVYYCVGFTRFGKMVIEYIYDADKIVQTGEILKTNGNFYTICAVSNFNPLEV